MAAAWAYQDYERPLDLLDKRAAKINLLKECVVEVEKKLAAKEEELKTNEVELVAKVKELKKAQTEVAQLGGELNKLREEAPLLKAQLDQERTTTTQAISEFQASEEMTTIKKSSQEEGFDASV